MHNIIVSVGSDKQFVISLGLILPTPANVIILITALFLPNMFIFRQPNKVLDRIIVCRSV